MKSRDKLIAACLASFCCLVIALTMSQYGITWDEGSYILAGESYAEWMKQPSLKSIDTFWKINHEHPPLCKIAGGITGHLFFHEGEVLNRVTAFRLSILLFVFVLIYSLFCFSFELYGPSIASFVVLSFFFLPRIFFHSHLATLDYPITAMWFVVLYGFWKGRNGNWRWALLSAFVLGFALLTKLNALFLYIPIILCWAVFHRKPGKSSSAAHLPFRTLFPMFVVPPVLFFSFWPWLWEHPRARVVELLLFHLRHFDIPVFFLGRQYLIPPWYYPWVMMTVTVPLIILGAFMLGIWCTRFMPGKRRNLFILFNAFFPMALVSLPWVPKYDGVRLFLPAFPFICMISGLGLQYAYAKLQDLKWRRLYVCCYLFLFLLSLYFSVAKIHPMQSSYFNELAGGIDGAAEMGFEPEYWGSAYRETLTWMNRHDDCSYWLCMTSIDPKAYFPFAFYKEMGILNEKVRFTSRDKADYAVLLVRQGFFDREMWRYFLDEEPVFSVKASNTTLVGIYRMNRKK